MLPGTPVPVLFAIKRLVHRWFLAQLCGLLPREFPRRMLFQQRVRMHFVEVLADGR